MNANRLISIALGLVAAGVLALGWFIGISPKLAEADAADASRLLVETQNASYEAAIVDLAAKYENIDDLRAELEKLEEYIPGTPDLEDYIDALSAAAGLNAVTITSITISEPLPAVAPEEGAAPVDPAASTPTGAPVAGEALFSIPITVVVEGPMPQVIGFLGEAQKQTRLFFVASATLVDDGTKTTGTLLGSVYVIADPANLDAPEDQTPEPTETAEPTPEPTETPAP